MTASYSNLQSILHDSVLYQSCCDVIYIISHNVTVYSNDAHPRWMIQRRDLHIEALTNEGLLDPEMYNVDLDGVTSSDLQYSTEDPEESDDVNAPGSQALFNEETEGLSDETLKIKVRSPCSNRPLTRVNIHCKNKRTHKISRGRKGTVKRSSTKTVKWTSISQDNGGLGLKSRWGTPARGCL